MKKYPRFNWYVFKFKNARAQAVNLLPDQSPEIYGKKNGAYAAIGPFKTERGAAWAAYNEHGLWQTVNEAEKLALLESKKKNPSKESSSRLYRVMFRTDKPGKHYIKVYDGLSKKEAKQKAYHLSQFPNSEAMIEPMPVFNRAEFEVSQKKLESALKKHFDINKNPVKLSTEARELDLFAENDADLYRQQFIPIIKNLKRKIKKGTYDHSLAPKLWKYWYDNAAKKYAKEHGGSFSIAVRKEAAKYRADYEYQRIMAGEYSHVEPKIKQDKPLTNPKGARAFDARKIKSNKIPSKDTVIRVRHLYVSGIGKEKIKQDFSMNDKILDKILSGDFGKGKHTRKNPKKKTRYFIQAKKGKLTGLFTGKISLTDDIHKAAVYDNKEFAVETAGKLNRNFPAWKWSVIPASSFKR